MDATHARKERRRHEQAGNKDQHPHTAPHPFPYQGSKRGIAKFILPYFPPGIDRVVEPCCGSAAVSIAAATHGLARRFWINDLNAPLMALWMEIVERPEQLVADYARLWRDQQPHMKEFSSACAGSSTSHISRAIFSICWPES